jgi:hypothetical protein|tara:strand:+ start:4292 stop:4474 length:183 start_codon:yes stop_codon:yes gene_type:complete
MTNQWHGGKGSKNRTKDAKTYSDNWDAIFGKKEEPSEVEVPEEKIDEVAPRAREPWDNRP